MAREEQEALRAKDEEKDIEAKEEASKIPPTPAITPRKSKRFRYERNRWLEPEVVNLVSDSVEGDVTMTDAE